MRFRSDIWGETIYFYASDIWCRTNANDTKPILMNNPFDFSKTSTNTTLFATMHYWIEEQAHYTIDPNSGIDKILNDKHVRTLFEQYLIPRIWNRYALFCQEEWEDMVEECAKFCYKLIGWVSSTYSNYSRRIDFYEKTMLEDLDPIKMSNDSYTNLSTEPNVTATDSSLTGEVNVTNTQGTHTETKSDGGTLAQRYEEADRAMKNLYETWADEFMRHFSIYKNVV